MDIEDRCALIEEFVREYGKYEFADRSIDFIEFMTYNDLGIPLAQSIVYSLAELTEEGEGLIEETWLNLCNMVDTDPEGEYESIYDMGNLNNNE